MFFSDNCVLFNTQNHECFIKKYFFYVCLSVCGFGWLVYFFTYLFIYLPIYLFICLFIYFLIDFVHLFVGKQRSLG